MSADSFHHRAEQETLKKHLEGFQDFFGIVETCGQSIVMNYHDFFKIHWGLSQAKYTASKPKFEDIQSVKFDKGSERMFWKRSHTQEEFYIAQFLQRKLIKSLGNDFQQTEKSQGVSTSKKEDIVTTLCPHLKGSRQLFWQNLPINDETVDLIANRDLSEMIFNFISLFSSYRSSINFVFKVLKQFHNINRAAYFKSLLFSTATS